MHRLSIPRVARLAIGAAFSLSISPALLAAQVCLGGPSSGGIAYENGKQNFASSQGASLNFVPGAVAIGLDGRYIDASLNETGYGGAFRFAVVLGGKLKVCPMLGVGYDRLSWDVDADSKLNSDRLVGRGGVGLGYEFDVNKRFSIAPHVGIEYVYFITHYDLQIAGSDPNNTATNRGEVQAAFGFVAKYSHVFLGASFNHQLEKAPAFSRRLYAGFAF